MLVAKNLRYETPNGLLFEGVDISLDSDTPKRVAIVGRNGCGKSTLLKLLKGDLTPSEGTVTRSRETVAHLQQDIQFPDETHTTGQYLVSKLEEEWMAYKIDMVLEEVNLPATILEQPLNTLSGGQRVRIALAELLIDDPTILLLDEPTNHLDLFLREDLERFLLEQDLAMCIISHDTYFIEKVGITRVIELN